MLAIASFHFLRPYCLLLLIPLSFILWALCRQLNTRTAWRSVCDPHLIPHIIQQFGNKQRTMLVILLAIAWLAGVLALAGPSWQRLTQPLYQNSYARVLALDLSPAMLAQDIAPSRIARVKYKIRDLLQQDQEGQFGLIVFSSEPYVVSPITEDASTIIAMLPELRPDIMPVTGSNIAAALDKAVQLLQQGDSQRGEILLITANPVKQVDLKAAAQIHADDIQVSVLGVGTAQGAPIPVAGGFVQDNQGNTVLSRLDVSGLTQLAKAGGGVYTSLAQSDQDIMTLLVSSGSSQGTLNQQAQQTEVWQDQGYYLLWLVLPLVLLGFRRGWFELITQ